MSKFSKMIVYVLVAVISLGGILYYADNSGSNKAASTSVLNVMKSTRDFMLANINTDLAIDSVSLKKTEGPKKDFPYYKFEATLIVRNAGDNLGNAKLVISAGDHGVNKFVRNTEKGFSLKAGEKYIIRNYEVIFPAKYNGGEIEFTISLNDRPEKFTENNTYTTDVYAGPAKLSDFEISKITEEGFEISFEKADLDEAIEYTLMTSNKLDLDSAGEYFETEIDDEILNYFLLENSSEYLSPNWEEEFLFQKEKASVDSKFAFIKGTNEETGNYVVSDIIYLADVEKLSKAEFAKYFVEEADIEINEIGDIYFSDVDQDSDNFKYVQTLYNLGLLDTDDDSFNPESLISRAEVLPIVLAYFDLDFEIKEDAKSFKDVSEKSGIYPYVESLVSKGYLSGIGKEFNPERAASKSFVNYLIHAVREDS